MWWVIAQRSQSCDLAASSRKGNFSTDGDSETTTHRSSEVGRQTMYSHETFFAVPDTDESHPDLPGMAASLLQSTPRRVVVNCCVLFFQTRFGKLAFRVHSDAPTCRLKQASCQPPQADPDEIRLCRGQPRRFHVNTCLLYTSPSPRDRTRSRMPSSA